MTDTSKTGSIWYPKDKNGAPRRCPRRAPLAFVDVQQISSMNAYGALGRSYGSETAARTLRSLPAVRCEPCS